MKKVLFALAIAGLAASLDPGAARADYCGRYMADACGSCSQWTGAMSNYPDMGSGYSCAGYSGTGYRYQCVELAQRFYNVLWGYPGVWYANAYQMCGTHPGGVYTEASSCGNFWHGDLMVYPRWTCGTGAYGHVAIVSNCDYWGSGSHATVVEQNWSWQGCAHVNPGCGACGLWTYSNPWRHGAYSQWCPNGQQWR